MTATNLELAPEESLVRSLASRFQLEIRHEASRSFSTLKWIRDDLSEFVLQRSSLDGGVTAEIAFLALLKRRILNRYRIALETPADIGWGSESDWARFETAATEWLERRMSVPVDASQVRENARHGRELKKLVERHCAGLGWKVTRISRELAMSPSALGQLRVHSYFAAGRGGFSYWQDILLPGASVASLRESYLSMFGIASQTDFHSLSRPDVDIEAVSSFVVGEVAKLLDFVRTAT